MQYEIDVGGRTRQVAVTRVGDGFAVAVDGRTWHVDASRIDAHILSLIVDRVSQHEISLVADPAGALAVRVGVTPLDVAVNARQRWSRKDEGGGAGGGPQRVVAPMPGKVVRVLVAAGDAVRARQPIVVVEAMKMENELRAARDGTVSDVHAREGMSVDAGALLAVIQ